MSAKVMFIAPYERLKLLADEVIAELQLPVLSVVGELREGVRLAEQGMKTGTEIVVSRGGTATVIKQHLDLPVVEVKVTGYDLLRVLYKYRDYPGRIGVVGYSNVITGSRVIGEIIGLDLHFMVIAEEQEVVSKIQEAARMGIEVIIGDTVSVETARKLGLKGDLIVSGKEAVAYALTEACSLYKLTVKEREQRKQFKAILDFSHEGIMAVDQEGIVSVYNPAAEKIFGIGRELVIGRRVDEVIPNTRLPHIMRSGKMELGKIQQTQSAMIATNRVPIVINDEVVGAVATFQDVTKIQELEQQIRRELSEKGLVARHRFSDITGTSKAIKAAIHLAEKYSATDSTVLIIGETGTGKELFAQSIHNASRRQNGSFVAVNCAALPGSLLESELFGYREGAFTGARKGGKQGLFELAHNGTIFLDEINGMDTGLQARLLRVIQEREVMRLGDDKIIPVNIRVIAATNKDLRPEVEQGRFREDLYYRLHVLNLELPPLRKRKGDIALLVSVLLHKFNRKYARGVQELETDVLQELEEYHWPGNIRELQNVIEKLVVVTGGSVVRTEDLAAVLTLPEQTARERDSRSGVALHGTLAEIEQRIVQQVLAEEQYNKSRAAERLGIDRGTLQRKLQR